MPRQTREEIAPMAGIISSDDVNAMFDAMESVSEEQKRYQRERYVRQILGTPPYCPACGQDTEIDNPHCDHGETAMITGIITWNDMQTTPTPERFRYTGAPSIIVIDANNEDHWQYADDYAQEHRERVTEMQLPVYQFGYTLGYYPVDMEDGQLVGIGPFCADCVETDISNMQPGDDPIAYHVELIQEPSCIESGPNGDLWDHARCSECGAVMYEIDEDMQEYYPMTRTKR